LLVKVKSIGAAEFTAWSLVGSYDLIILFLVRYAQASNEKLVVYLVTKLLMHQLCLPCAVTVAYLTR
jgi:hypothetical protein